LNCTRPLDPLDLEALASGEIPVVAADAAAHARSCPDCGLRMGEFRDLGAWLDGLSGPAVPEGFGERVVRLRGFSARENRSFRMWLVPGSLAAALAGGSAALLSIPFPGAGDNVGLLAALALEWRTLATWPSTLGRAMPAVVSALSELLLRDRGFAAASILLMIPAGFGVSRLWARHAIRRQPIRK